MSINLILGDCLDKLKDLEENSVDSIVTDPPYGLGQVKDTQALLIAWMNDEDDEHAIGKNGFMGKEWDKCVPSPKVWKQCFRVLKPGGHLLCFAGTRTQDLMGISIRIAGFELRDEIAYMGNCHWVYGSGFPKSHNIGKAVDKLQGNERESTGEVRHRNVKPYDDENGWNSNDTKGDFEYTKGNSPWEGWGTALKPAHEPILMFRKPLSEKSVAENVLKHGTGGINIDDCRVGETKNVPASPSRTNGNSLSGSVDGSLRKETGEEDGHNPNVGRFPANLIHDGSEEVVECFPYSTSGAVKEGTKQGFSDTNIYGTSKGVGTERKSSEGSASRFFYCAKCSKTDRNEGCEEEEKLGGRNVHPT